MSTIYEEQSVSVVDHGEPARFRYRLLLPAIMGNLVGGAGVFALLAHAQVRGEMRQKD